MNAPRPWYRTADMAPPKGARVKVLWDGRVFEAALVVRPGQRFETCWLTQHRGAAVFLPLDADERLSESRRLYRDSQPKPWIGYHGLGVATDDPDYWSPLNPEAWTGRMPEPAFSWDENEPPRLWAEQQSFDAVDAALLAAEMEGDREAARVRKDAQPPPDKQWWLDAGLVTYSRPGSITPREAEGRLMRAFIAERWVDLDHPGWGEGGDDGNDIPVRIEPNGRDQDDMLIALKWLEAVPSYAHERVLRQRGQTPALTWRRIGAAMNLSHEGARQLYAAALGAVTAAANGKTTARAQAVCNRLEAVREANRRHKRGSTAEL